MAFTPDERTAPGEPYTEPTCRLRARLGRGGELAQRDHSEASPTQLWQHGLKDSCSPSASRPAVVQHYDRAWPDISENMPAREGSGRNRCVVGID